MANTVITSELAKALDRSFPEVDGNDRSVVAEGSNYYLDASFNISTLEYSCEFYFDGEFIELTEKENEQVAEFLYKLEEEESTGFTQNDYELFESYIYKS